MKKLSVLFFTILFAFVFAVAVNAVSERILFVEVEVAPPSAAQSPKDLLLGEAKIIATSDGVGAELRPHGDFNILGCSWKEKDSELLLGAEDHFISGRTYLLEVEIEIVADLTVTAQTSFVLGGTEARLVSSGEDGKKLTVVAEMLAIPMNIEPQVSLVVEGDKTTKKFDGKGITLTAQVEELGGIRYEYAWYRDNVLIEGATQSSYIVRDVSQSGEYLCAVTARVAGNDSFEAKEAKTQAQSIKITPTSITVQIEDAEKNLSDPDPEFTYTVLGNVYDPIEGKPERQAGESIGTYAIRIGTIGFEPAKAANYKISVKQGTLNILDVNELPFSAVANIADLSYITGAKQSKIRASASKGTLPDGAILSFNIASTEAKNALIRNLNRKILKAFTVSILSRDGKEISLPKHGTIRFQIPLTDEEAVKFKESPVEAGFYGTDAAFLSAEVVESEGVSYITLEITSLGTVAVFQSVPKPTPSTTAKVNTDKKTDDGSLWLWILIGALSLVAASAIIFTVVFSLNSKRDRENEARRIAENEDVKIAPNPKNGENDPLAQALSSTAKEKERQGKIAEELNAKSPLPTKEKPKKKSEKTVVSFEDLED